MSQGIKNEVRLLPVIWALTELRENLWKQNLATEVKM
jgi:hypothetical protein